MVVQERLARYPLIAPRVPAKRSLIKFYCAGIKLTGWLAWCRLPQHSTLGLWSSDKWFISAHIPWRCHAKGATPHFYCCPPHHTFIYYIYIAQKKKNLAPLWTLVGLSICFFWTFTSSSIWLFSFIIFFFAFLFNLIIIIRWIIYFLAK